MLLVYTLLIEIKKLQNTNVFYFLKHCTSILYEVIAMYEIGVPAESRGLFPYDTSNLHSTLATYLVTY